MTDTAIATQAKEIIISSNEEFVYWCDYLKNLTLAIGKAEKLKAAIKEKITGYRAVQEAERKKEETAVLRQARALNEPAIVTRMIPSVPGVHYRKKLKWRVKNLRTVPAAYKITTTDDKAINAAVKALGKEANIRGIEIFSDESAVVTGGKDGE